MKLIRKLYDWVISLAGHRHAVWFLALIAFIESSVFPIPPDALLIPMILANRDKAWLYAGVCTVASVLGGAAGYAIGYFLYDTVGHPLLEFYGYSEKFETFSGKYNDYGIWIVLGAGLTPFPYKVITIASGVTQLNFPLFMLSSVVARGLRFYLVGALLWRFGPPIREFIEKYLGWVTLAGFILLIGGFVSIKYLL